MKILKSLFKKYPIIFLKIRFKCKNGSDAMTVIIMGKLVYKIFKLYLKSLKFQYLRLKFISCLRKFMKMKDKKNKLLKFLKYKFCLL